MSSEKEIIACVTLMASTLRQEVTPAMLSGYVLALSDLTEAQMRRAVGRALCECKFMPAPAELRIFAGVGNDLVAEMAEAWGAVRSAMDRCDYTNSVDFGPLVNAVIRNLGGWQWLCTQSLNELVWRRKDFERVYEAFRPKAIETLQGAPLAGAFGGPPVRVAIGGVTPLRQLTGKGRNQVLDVVRELADGKAAP